MRLAVVVPVFNEAAAIESTLARLAPLRKRGARVIVVDGGSTDDSATLATDALPIGCCSPHAVALSK